MELTITEALQEIKTIGSRLVKKRESVRTYVVRPGAMKDPLVKEDGGSAGFIERTMQSVSDLEQRIVYIRSAIQNRNQEVELTLRNITPNVYEVFKLTRLNKIFRIVIKEDPAEG